MIRESALKITFKTLIEARLRPMNSCTACGGANQASERFGAWQLSGKCWQPPVNYCQLIFLNFHIFQGISNEIQNLAHFLAARVEGGGVFIDRFGLKPFGLEFWYS